jgi:hypothetical protein
MYAAIACAKIMGMRVSISALILLVLTLSACKGAKEHSAHGANSAAGTTGTSVTDEPAGGLTPASLIPTPPELQKIRADFLGALRQGNVNRFISLISEDGITLGTERPLTKKQIIEQLRTKTELYCVLFDSKCLNRERDASSRVCSYRELLATSDEVAASIALHDNDPEQASLLAEVKNFHCSERDTLDFTFARVASGWKLSAIPQP